MFYLLEGDFLLNVITVCIEVVCSVRRKDKNLVVEKIYFSKSAK